LELLRRARLRDLRARLRLELFDPLDHDARTLDEREAGASSRVSSYSATVAAIAALSECDAIGMRALRSHARTISSGSPSRSAPALPGSATPGGCSHRGACGATRRGSCTAIMRVPEPGVEHAARASALTSRKPVAPAVARSRASAVAPRPAPEPARR